MKTKTKVARDALKDMNEFPGTKIVKLPVIQRNVRLLVAIAQGLLCQTFEDLASRGDSHFTLAGKVDPRSHLIPPVRATRPDIFIYEPPESEADPIARCMAVRAACPEVKIVLVTGMFNAQVNDYLAREAGIDGFFLLSACSREKLRIHLPEIANGHTCHEGLSTSFVSLERTETVHLTLREKEVAALVGQGLTHKEISKRLGWSKNVIDKLSGSIKNKRHTQYQHSQKVPQDNRISS